MTGNNSFDAIRMFRHACAFVDCAIFCETEKHSILVTKMSHTVAGIVNSAFACEVFIKSLLVHGGKTIKDIRGHNLQQLWEWYKDLDSNGAMVVKQRVESIFQAKNKKTFDDALNNISNAFEEWRYIYEKRHATIHINFLRIFRQVLRSFCCETLLKRTWDDYIGEQNG